RPRTGAAQIRSACNLGATARAGARQARRISCVACAIPRPALACRPLQPDRQLSDQGRLDLRGPGRLSSVGLIASVGLIENSVVRKGEAHPADEITRVAGYASLTRHTNWGTLSWRIGS